MRAILATVIVLCGCNSVEDYRPYAAAAMGHYEAKEAPLTITPTKEEASTDETVAPIRAKPEAPRRGRRRG